MGGEVRLTFARDGRPVYVPVHGSGRFEALQSLEADEEEVGGLVELFDPLFGEEGELGMNLASVEIVSNLASAVAMELGSRECDCCHGLPLTRRHMVIPPVEPCSRLGTSMTDILAYEAAVTPVAASMVAATLTAWSETGGWPSQGWRPDGTSDQGRRSVGSWGVVGLSGGSVRRCAVEFGVTGSEQWQGKLTGGRRGVATEVSNSGRVSMVAAHVGGSSEDSIDVAVGLCMDGPGFLLKDGLCLVGLCMVGPCMVGLCMDGAVGLCMEGPGLLLEDGLCMGGLCMEGLCMVGPCMVGLCMDEAVGLCMEGPGFTFDGPLLFGGMGRMLAGGVTQASAQTDMGPVMCTVFRGSPMLVWNLTYYVDWIVVIPVYKQVFSYSIRIALCPSKKRAIHDGIEDPSNSIRRRLELGGPQAVDPRTGCSRPGGEEPVLQLGAPRCAHKEKVLVELSSHAGAPMTGVVTRKFMVELGSHEGTPATVERCFLAGEIASSRLTATVEARPVSAAPGAMLTRGKTATVRRVSLPTDQGPVEQSSRPCDLAGRPTTLLQRSLAGRAMDTRVERSSPVVAPLGTPVMETGGDGDSRSVVELSSHRSGKAANLRPSAGTEKSPGLTSVRTSRHASQVSDAVPRVARWVAKQMRHPYEVASSDCNKSESDVTCGPLPDHKALIAPSLSVNYSNFAQSLGNTNPKTLQASSFQVLMNAAQIAGNTNPKAYWESLDPLAAIDSDGFKAYLDTHLETVRRNLDFLIASLGRAVDRPQEEAGLEQRE